MNFHITYVSLLLLIIISSCKSDVDPDPTVAINYVNEVIDIMQSNSINRDSIDWTDFKAKVMSRATGVTTLQGTYPVILYAISLLHDNHSFYISSAGKYYFNSEINCSAEPAANIIPSDNIGYVRVPGFMGDASSSQASDLIQQLQNKIKSQDNDSIKGWIVDLRGNTGGNMWPMLAGIGPILGNGICGYFMQPTGRYQSNAYQDGSALSSDVPICSASSPYKLLHEPKKVAVLIDRSTASSGEAIAISFIGRTNTMLFGESATCGLSTGNQAYKLSNGAYLYLTTSVDADRNFHKYGGPVAPDVLDLKGQTFVSKDAVAWLIQ